MKLKSTIKNTLKVVSLAFVSSQIAHAGEIQFTVDTISDQPQAGLTTLREAIEAANLVGESEIVFDDEVFLTPQTIVLENGEMIITSNVTIDGPGADLLTIDADNLSRIFLINDNNSQSSRRVNIFGITLTNGNVTGNGGCISSSERLLLSASVIKNCSSSSEGGGVKTTRSDSVIENSTFLNNIAQRGGGLAHQAGQNSFVIGSTFSGNSASNRGGGINIRQTGSFTVINSTLSNNQSGAGAGINANSAVNITHSTIVNNTGSGVRLNEDNIQNSIIAGNTEGDCVFDDIAFDNQNNFDGDGSCATSPERVDINNGSLLGLLSDPMLGPLADNGGLTQTHLPLTGSPVIDAGDDFNCAEFDQRGMARPIDGDGDEVAVCDIGAVEFNFEFDEVIFSDGFD